MHTSQIAHPAGTYPNLNGMDVLLPPLLLDGTLIYHRLPQVFRKIFMTVHLHPIKRVGGDRLCGNKVFCPRLHHNDPARFPNRTSQPGVQHFNCLVTASLYRLGCLHSSELEGVKFHIFLSCENWHKNGGDIYR